MLGPMGQGPVPRPGAAGWQDGAQMSPRSSPSFTAALALSSHSGPARVSRPAARCAPAPGGLSRPCCAPPSLGEDSSQRPWGASWLQGRAELGCVSEAGPVREEAGDHVVLGPAPPSGPTWGALELQPQTRLGCALVLTCADRLSWGQAGGAGAPVCPVVGQPGSWGSGVPLEMCLWGWPREIAAREGGPPGPSTTLSARGRPACWMAACPPASRPRL